MLEQLKELLEMQRVLDQSIFDAKGITEYPSENMKIALFVELGELMNEFPTKFKHWKSSAVDNREKGLVEYVDCLHFALSLVNYWNTRVPTDFERYAYQDLKQNVDDYTYTQLFRLINGRNAPLTLIWLFVLGNKLGFTWEEIYQTYKKKNEINYERLRNNY